MSSPVIRQPSLGINVRGPWNNATVYNTDDEVTFSGTSYISLTDFNVNNQPDTSPAAWSPSYILPTVNAMLPIPSGADDTAALNAAIANAAVGAVLQARPNVTYKVASSWFINKLVTILLQGSKIQKILSGSSNFYAVDITAAGVRFDGGYGEIDGNRAAQALQSGGGIRNNSYGRVDIQNLKVHACGGGGSGVGAEANSLTDQVTVCRNVEAYDCFDPQFTHNAHGFSFLSAFRCYNCHARNNDGYGFLIAGIWIGNSAAPASSFNGTCSSDHNSLGGFNLANHGTGSASKIDTLFAHDNEQYGIIFTDATNWDIGTLESSWTGAALGGNYPDGSGRVPTGTGIEFLSGGGAGCNGIQAGTIISRASTGYGLAINQTTDLQAGTVNIDGTGAYDSDPGIQVADSSDVRMGIAQVRGHTLGLEVGDGLAAVNRLNVGTLETEGCAYGLVRFDATSPDSITNPGVHTDCHIGQIIDHNSYTVDSNHPGLIEFRHATRCTIGDLYQVNDGTNKPTYVIVADSASTNCEVRNLHASVFVTGLISDAGTDNQFGPLRVTAGAPTDGAFPYTPPNGTLAVDSTNNKLYVRVGGVWKGVTVA